MKHLKSWIKYFEQADSPELVGKFSKDDIRKMTFADDPYAKDKPRKFQYGLFAGPASYDLNVSIDNAKEKGYGSMYGISEYLLSELRKAVPDFKDYELGKYDSVYGDLYEGKIGLHLKKEVKLQGTRFNAESEIWIYYHTKGDKYLDYKKGKIYILFTCGLRPSDPSVSLGNPFGKQTDTDKEVSKSFGDMMKKEESPCTKCGEDELIEIDDKKFDIFFDKLQDALYGHPDKEDKDMHDRLGIYHKNLTIPSFLKTLPKVKTNLDYFKKYVFNKYKLEF